ncbi:MAG: class I adenylate-forming enzyme family protein [Lautropia sp.]
MNFSIFPEMRARGTPTATAVIDRRCRLDWRELDHRAGQFAQLLQSAGAGVGDRVAMYLPNRVELVIAFLGALKSGVIAVPLNWRLQGPDLARLVSHCAPCCLVTTTGRAADPALAAARRVLAVDEDAAAGSFWQAIDAQPGGLRSRPCQADEIANLLYTSGTTATPKAAIHTHGMRVAVAGAMADCFDLSSADVGLAISPIFHTSGMSVMSNTLFAGCPLVLLDRWDVAELVAAIERERVTFMHVIGTVVVDIAQAPAALFDRDLSSMRFAWGGGHSLDRETFDAYERRIGGVLLQGYSRTEGGLAYNPLDRARRRLDANGFPNRNSSDLAIVTPGTGQTVPAGATGEIVVRGDGVSPGYWDGQYQRMPRLYDGGWQPTGDLGYFDDEGSLHFLGRQDHMIKTGGENVYPAEVEAVLLAMPEVADAVVVGLPDSRLGQRVAALVVPQAGRVTAADIDRACRAALGGFKIPRTIAFTDALPKLGSQKVDLEACRRLLAAAAG